MTITAPVNKVIFVSNQKQMQWVGSVLEGVSSESCVGMRKFFHRKTPDEDTATTRYKVYNINPQIDKNTNAVMSGDSEN